MRNAQALVDTGLRDLGYRYVNVDGCWQAVKRDGHGNLQPNSETFPSGMAELGRRIHALGLRFGIYTSAGYRICTHPHRGSWNHFRKDMRRFAAWEVDYVKVDWCDVPKDSDPRDVYPRVARAAAESGRTMLVTVSTPGVRKPWRWASRYGNTWRISADADGTWRGVTATLDVDAPLARWAGPGGWNDPDMLQLGSPALSLTEQRSHFSLWAMLAAPLLEGYDVPSLDPESLAILKNERVIAVNQDRRGRQARRARRRNGLETWVKPLRRRERALLFLNRSGRERTAKVTLADVPGLRDAPLYSTRELWTGEVALKEPEDELRATVPPHGVAMWRIEPRAGGLPGAGSGR